MKKALITGITGQDGSYLAEFLLKKNYQVHGIIRKSSSFNTQRIDHIYQNPQTKKRNLYLYYGDLTDPSSISEIIAKVKPHEIYNLAAQSHVKVSFDEPYYTSMTNAMGTLNILQSIKFLGLKKTKFYQASTSELYGNNKSLLSEKTGFDPRSPYAAAKLMAFNLTKIYRDSYNMFCANGILFNHESPRRGETFVTKKIVNGLVAIKKNKLKCLYLGNLNAKRDWGHAIDYVKAQWLILQTKKPDDYVIATGKSYSIREFIKLTCKKLDIIIKFKGSGLKEIGVNQNGKTIIRVDKKYFRPLEVPALKGNFSKARKLLKWKPKYDINDLIDDMIKNEIEKI
mgnify:CR=1 FL=1|tara:strand:+ start:2583 stop:3605 length:1023 start_codon:yes stop_codon:yes gene_type:complete